MKLKVGTLLEEDVLRKAKRRAVDEGRPLSDLIQNAIENYLSSRAVEPAKRDAAFRLFCDHPMKLTTAQFKAVLTTLVWSGVGSAIIYKVVDVLVGLRVPAEAEREGLDITAHGERAYTM